MDRKGILRWAGSVIAVALLLLLALPLARPRAQELDPGFWQRSILPQMGLATYYSQGMMDYVHDYRIQRGQLPGCEECVGSVALLRAGDIGRKVWLQPPGGELAGPFLVVDCARPEDIPPLLDRNWVVDVSYELGQTWGMSAPLDGVIVWADPSEGNAPAPAAQPTLFYIDPADVVISAPTIALSPTATPALPTRLPAPRGTPRVSAPNPATANPVGANPVGATATPPRPTSLTPVVTTPTPPGGATASTVAVAATPPGQGGTPGSGEVTPASALPALAVRAPATPAPLGGGGTASTRPAIARATIPVFTAVTPGPGLQVSLGRAGQGLLAVRAVATSQVVSALPVGTLPPLTPVVVPAPEEPSPAAVPAPVYTSRPILPAPTAMPAVRPKESLLQQFWRTLINLLTPG